MKKRIKQSIAAIVALCVVTSLGISAAAADTAEETKISVNLDSVYDLAYAGNIDSEIADLSLKNFYAELDDLEDQIDGAWALMTSADPVSQMYGSIMMDSLMPKQVSSAGKESTELSAELSKKQIALGGRSMLMAYYNAQLQYEQLRVEADKASGDADAARVMASLGLKTELEVQSLEQSLDKLNHSIEAIEDSISKLKTQIALYINVDESELLIDSFEGISAEKADEFLAAIDYSADLASSTDNSMTIKIQKLKVKDSSGYQKDIEQLKLDQMTDQLPPNFDELYKELSQATLNFKDEEAAYQISESNYKYAEMKFGLGIISKLDLDNAHSQCRTEQNKMQSSSLAFSAAMYNYKAMVDGIYQQN